MNGPRARPTYTHVVLMPMAHPLLLRSKTSVIIETLVVTTAAAPIPMVPLNRMIIQNSVLNGARMHDTAIVSTPPRNILRFPEISAILDSGTMKTTEDRRNAVLTYPSEWDPTENSLPRASKERFIMVLNSGVMNAAAQHAIIRRLLSDSV